MNNIKRRRPTVTPEVLRQLLDYDAGTGVLTWKQRQPLCSCHVAVSETARWNRRYAGTPAFTARNIGGYLSGAVYKRSLLAHVVAWAIVHGKWGDGQIDHINGLRDDNRLANLRCVPSAENNKNRALPKNNRSGRIGVSYHERDRRWVAHIGVGGRHTVVGRFRTMEEAIQARRAAEIEHGFHENHGRSV